jgi:hypothetical protein
MEDGPYEKIKRLIRNYEGERGLDNESWVDNATREKEIKCYVCSVFVHHWFLELDQTPDPRFSVSEAVSRVDVAEAQGYRAFKRIDELFKEQHFGGLDLVGDRILLGKHL